MTIQLLTGDCRDVLATLPECSVHTVVTSPPYYGLRDYGTAQWEGGADDCEHIAPATGPTQNKGNNGRNGQPYRDVCGKCGVRRIDRQLGLEATPKAYLAAMVEVFRAVRRVMRPDATLWLNVGDAYTDKQLQMMPARLALALQADGWWIRSDIIWHKPNPMPESCTDRPTSAHEHVFLLSKRARYFYDADAVREEQSDGTIERFGKNPARSLGGPKLAVPGIGVKNNSSMNEAIRSGIVEGGRNLRNVWTIPTHAYSDAHFATFPPALVERCIRAGTSERGCCSACGAPWVRVTERTGEVDQSAKGSYFDRGKTGARDGGDRTQAGERFVKQATGWRASCQCNAEVVPCTVLDPFVGSGTTALVADRLQRHAIGIDLSIDYAAMAQRRLEADCPLFTSWAPAETDAEDERMRDLFSVAAD